MENQMSNMTECNTQESQTRKSTDARLGKDAFGAMCAFGLGIWVFYDLSQLKSGNQYSFNGFAGWLGAPRRLNSRRGKLETSRFQEMCEI